MPTPCTAAAAEPDQQGGGPPAEGFMAELAGHDIPRNALKPATRTPIISLPHTAGNHSTVSSQELSGHFKARIVKAAESGQVREMEGSAVHKGLAVERSDLDTPSLARGPHLYTISVLTQDKNAAHTLNNAMRADPNLLAQWDAAVTSDGKANISNSGFISKYAADNPRPEDFGESLVVWLSIKFHQDRLREVNAAYPTFIKKQIPNRIKFFGSCVTELLPMKNA